MAFRLPTFVCANGHRYEQLVQSDVTTSTCRCGAPAESKPYRPGDRMNVRSCERVSRDEVKQYLAQFGERDENGKWKFIPKNRDELNVALKMEGVVAISDREFNDLVDKRDSQREQERAEAPSPLAGETGVEFAKARRVVPQRARQRLPHRPARRHRILAAAGRGAANSGGACLGCRDQAGC
jgi:CDGSH-type Zn-finger protein